jgi:hypothetical protein
MSRGRLASYGFDEEGKIKKLTIAAVDLHPLTEAISAAAQSASVTP